MTYFLSVLHSVVKLIAVLLSFYYKRFTNAICYIVMDEVYVNCHCLVIMKRERILKNIMKKCQIKKTKRVIKVVKELKKSC